MKSIQHRKSTVAALAALALAGSVSAGLAADIVYNFNADTQGWAAADGHGSIVWDGTHGRGSNGCLKCTIVSGTDTEIDPRVAVAFDTKGYFSVEFDMMVDPASGTSAGGDYGNLQIIARDASWSWDSMWYGAIVTGFTNWTHVQRTFTSAYNLKAYLQMQISPGTITGPDIVIYLDNIIIRDGTPPNQAVLYNFAWPETCVPASSWGAGPPVWSQDKTLNTNGCLKEVVNYGSGNTGWQDAPGEIHVPDFDPTKFTYMDFDLYLDAPTGLPTYGQYQLHYWWSWAGIGTVGLSSANIGKWTHYSLPIPASPTAVQHGIVLHPGGNNMSGVFTYYLANVTMWKPAAPPTIGKPVKASGAGGVQITMNQAGAQWQRDALCVPAGQADYSWYGKGGVTYSFTITNFPDAAKHPGFDAHLYIVNQDTIPGTDPGWNQVYGGCDWNAADIAAVRVENVPSGGVNATFVWKTNLPNANMNQLAAQLHSPTALGTWTLTFGADNTSVTLSHSSGISTNFTLPAEMVERFNAAASFIQLGAFKNDGANDSHNNNASATFSAFSMLGGGCVYPFEDTFPGPELTSNYPWRTSSSTAVLWVPAEIGFWLTWSLPDDGFVMQVSDSVLGPWTDAGIAYSVINGAAKTGGVPAANIPEGNAVFFRMIKVTE